MAVSNSTDRFNGVLASKAIKVPCKVATSANITLNGAQTINGVPVVSGDRVLVAAQTNSIENGIYIVDSSEWQRAADWDGSRDVTQGTLISALDSGGNLSQYVLSTPDPITIGTTPVTIDLYSTGASGIVPPSTQESSLLRADALGGWQEESLVRATDTGELRVYEPAGTDFLQFDYVGTSLLATLDNPTHTIEFGNDIVIQGSDLILDSGDIVLGGGTISGAGWLLPWETPIQWEDDTTPTPVITDFLVFAGFTPGGEPAPDPNLGNVTLLVTGETAAAGFTTTFSADIGGVGWTYTNGDPFSGAEVGYPTNANSKHGNFSIFCKGETGATFEGFVGPAQNSAEALVFFPTGLQEFTYEFWIDPSTEYKGLNPDGRWGNNFPVLSGYNDQNAGAQHLQIECDNTGRLNFTVPTSTGRVVVLAQVSTGASWDSSGWVQESWHHWAIVRESDGEFRAYFDGVLRATTGIGLFPTQATLQIVQPTNSQTMNFGCNQRNGQLPNGAGAAAYIDDLRLTKGVARYTGNFTPPGAPEGTAKIKQFVVGDPTYGVVLDGATVVSNADLSAPNVTVTTLTQSGRVIAGDPGTEDTGISIDGVNYLSSAKVSDLGGTNLAQFILHRHSTTIAPVIVSARSNSDTDAHALVTDGQSLMWMIGAGHDGVAYQRAAEIEFEVDGTAAANDMPGRIIMSTTPDGTKVPVERLRISSEGGLYLGEIAAADTDIAGKGQLWVNSADALLYFTDDLGNDYNLTAGGSGILSAKLAYDSTITSGDPGAGNFRLSSPTPSAATAMYVNDVDLNGVDMQAVMQQTAVGKLFRFANPDDPEIFNEYRVTSYTDNTGWWTVGISYVQGTNTLPAATTECRFEWFTRPAIDAGAFSGNSADIAVWDKGSNNKWIASGTAVRINTSSPSTDGRMVFGSMTTTTTVNPYLKFELGNSDNPIIFAQRLNNTQGYYQKANLNSTIDYRFGYRTSSVDTDIVRLTAADEFNIMAGGTLVFTERAAARAATAAEGELWVRNDTPNVLIYTDDAGTDWNLLDPGSRSTIITAGWTTGGGGSLTIAANAPLFYTEQATDDSPAAGQGQVWVRNDTPNTLMFTDDAGTDFVVSGSAAATVVPGILNERFAYDSTLTAADPGAGNFRLSSATPSTATAMYINDAGLDGVDVGLILAQCAIGDVFAFASPDDPTNYNEYRVTSKTDNTGWWTVGIDYVGGTDTLPVATTECRFEFSTDAKVDGSTVDNDMLVWNSATGAWEASNGGVTWDGSGALRLQSSVTGTRYLELNYDSELGINAIGGGTPTMRINDFGNWIYQDGVTVYYVHTNGSASLRMQATLNDFNMIGATTLTRVSIYPELWLRGSSAGNGLHILETAAAGADTAAYGQLWVKNDAPNVLYFTDDTGVDHNLINVGAAAQTITAGWTTGSGGSLTIAANAPLFYTEQATDDAPAAGQGQVWVRNDTPNTLMFTDDAGTDFVIGGAAAPSGITGTVADNQIVVGTGASTVDSSSELTYNDVTGDLIHTSGLTTSLLQTGISSGVHAQINVQDNVAEIQFSDDSVDTSVARMLFNISSGSSGLHEYWFRDNDGTYLTISCTNQIMTFAGRLGLIAQTDHGGSFFSGEGQIWVKSYSLGDELRFTADDNQSNDFSLQNVMTHTFAFDNATASADPGAGEWRFDNATLASVTNIYINDADSGGRDAAFFLANLQPGDVIKIREAHDAGAYFLARVSAATTDNTGWWTIPVTPIYTGGTFSVTQPSHIDVELKGPLQNYSIRDPGEFTPTGTTQTLTYSDGPAFQVDLESVTGNITITISGGPPSGSYGQMVVKVTQDSATARTVTWAGGTFRWPGGTAHPMNTTLNGFSIYTFETWDGGTTWWATGADYS